MNQQQQYEASMDACPYNISDKSRLTEERRREILEKLRVEREQRKRQVSQPELEREEESEHVEKHLHENSGSLFNGKLAS